MLSLPSFRDWYIKKESSALTRSREAASKGLAPVTGNLLTHSRSTMTKKELDGLLKHSKKNKSKKKSKKDD